MVEYSVKFNLANGSNLEMLLFNAREHRWLFKHRFAFPEKRARLEKPTLINETTLVVDYMNGVPQECNLRMNVIRPDKRGKQFYLGVDISKGSKLCVEFRYKKQEGIYLLEAVDLGNHGRVNMQSKEEGLIKPVEFPFPVKRQIENEFGTYRVPFLGSGGKELFFEFPVDYCKK